MEEKDNKLYILQYWESWEMPKIYGVFKNITDAEKVGKIISTPKQNEIFFEITETEYFQNI